MIHSLFVAWHMAFNSRYMFNPFTLLNPPSYNFTTMAFTILIFVVALTSTGKFVYSAGCAGFTPTPIWDLENFAGNWHISGMVLSNTPWGTYKDHAAIWERKSETVFDLWMYGTIVDPEGQEMVFDDWRSARVTNTERPGEHEHFRENGEVFANATVLFLDTDYCVWVQCSEFSGEGQIWAYLASKNRSMPDEYKTQVKSILKNNYGLDVDNKYIDIPNSGKIKSRPNVK